MPVRQFVSLIAFVIAAAAVTIGLGAGLAPFMPVSILTILLPVLLGTSLVVRGLVGRQVGKGKAGDG